jgi:hypothetical protein
MVAQESYEGPNAIREELERASLLIAVSASIGARARQRFTVGRASAGLTRPRLR